MNGAHLLADVVQSDGKVVVVGDDGATPVHMLVMRYNANGSLDGSFNGGRPLLGPANTVARAVALQPDGRIVVAGAVSSSTGEGPFGGMVVERVTSGGGADGSFGNHGFAVALGAAAGQAHAVAVQSDGKIVVGGEATGSDTYSRVAFARFNTNGSADSSFGSGGAEVLDAYDRFSTANSIAIQSDGKIVFGGSRRPDLRTTQVEAGRLNTNGQVDGSFAGGKYVAQLSNGGGFSSFFGVALQPDGRVVLAGSASDATVGAAALFVRLTTSGGVDGSFGGGVVRLRSADSVQCCAEQSIPLGTSVIPGANHVVVSAGEVFATGFYDSGNRARFAMWGLTGGGGPDTGFGSGGAVISPLSGANVFGTGLAVAPDGNLVATASAAVLFGGDSALVARFGGPPITPPPPPLSTSLSLSRRYKIRDVSRSGIKVTVTCTVGCRVSGTMTISYGAAKRLHIAPRGRRHPRTVTIASGSVTLRAAGRATLTMRLTGAARRAIGRQRSLSGTISIKATAGRTSVTRSHGINLVR